MMGARQGAKAGKLAVIAALAAAVAALSVVCLFIGSSNMSLKDCIDALARMSESQNDIRIIWSIRIPRVLAAIIAGAGLSVSGLIMQTVLGNAMASPSTLGVANAAVFGANLSIIAFAGGFLDTGNHLANYAAGANPYATSMMALSRERISMGPRPYSFSSEYSPKSSGKTDLTTCAFWRVAASMEA